MDEGVPRALIQQIQGSRVQALSIDIMYAVQIVLVGGVQIEGTVQAGHAAPTLQRGLASALQRGLAPPAAHHHRPDRLIHR